MASPAQEWQEWRQKRERGEVSKERWLSWARAYVSRLEGGPWRKFCEQHIRFVERER